MELGQDGGMECCHCKLSITCEKLELNCGHVLCAPCSKLLKGFLNYRHVLGILCPLCLQSVLQDMKDVELGNRDANTVNCENCERGTATIQCDHCCVNFCEKCDELIHMSKAMRKHDRHRFATPDLRELPWKIDNRIVEYSHPICSVHSNSQATEFCSQCRTMACDMCILDTHAEHPHESTEAVLLGWRQEMYRSFTQSTRLLDRMERMIMTLPDLIRNIGVDDRSLRGQPSVSPAPEYGRAPSTPPMCQYSPVLGRHAKDAVLVSELTRARKIICNRFEDVTKQLEERKQQLLVAAGRSVGSRCSQLRKQRAVLHRLKARALEVSQCVHTVLESEDGHLGMSTPFTESDDGGTVAQSDDVNELRLALQSVLEVDVLEQVGAIADSDISFSYSSYLHEVIRCYGRVGAAEVWLLDDGEAEVGQGNKGVTMGMAWKDGAQSITGPAERAAKGGIGGENVKGAGAADRSTHSPMSDVVRMDICNLLDQVTSVLNQSHALDRRIDLAIRGLGYDGVDEEDDGYNESADTLAYDAELQPYRLSAAFLEAESHASPLSKRMHAMLPRPIATVDSLTGPTSSYQHLQRDVEQHFNLLAALAAKRVKTLLGEVSRYAFRKSSYLQRQQGILNCMYTNLYAAILQALDILQYDDAAFAGMVECGYFEQVQTDLASCVDPFAFEQIASRCGDSLIPVVFPLDIASEIGSHGSIGGPPCPVDLRTNFDFDGMGSCVVFTWRPGASSSLGSADTEIGSFEVQMAVVDFVESGQWCLLDNVRSPFGTVATCSAEQRECLVLAKPYPSCVLQFRIRAVSKLGGAGAWSTVSSIRTPRFFKEVFQFAAPFDTNGLLFWLGTGKTGQLTDYDNPHRRGEVAVSASTSQGSLHIFVSHNADGSFCITHNRVHSWISVDIGEGRYLEPTHYCLRSAKGETWKLRNWELQGKVSKEDKWIILSKHRNCTALAASSFSVAHWPIGSGPNDGGGVRRVSSDVGASSSPSSTRTGSGSGEEMGSMPNAFRYFRVLQKGVNSSGDNFLVCNGIELYGMLHDEPVVVDLER